MWLNNEQHQPDTSSRLTLVKRVWVLGSVFAFVLVLLATVQALAAAPQKPQHARLARPVSNNVRAFTPAQRRMLSDIFHHQNKAYLPEATRLAVIRNAHRSPVPAMLGKGKPLPTQLLHQVTFLPEGLGTYLGLPAQRELRLGVIGNDVFLYNANQGLIVDILHNII